MRYLIDTNIIIFALKNAASVSAHRLRSTLISDQCVCSVVEAELFHGARKYDVPAQRETHLQGFLAPYQSLAFDSLAARHYALIRHDLERRGCIIGNNDLMIAAIAMANNLTVVTNNVDEFSRVQGLRVEDWSM
jgi:tRNA(fMet)-specific endonuclease VapC